MSVLVASKETGLVSQGFLLDATKPHQNASDPGLNLLGKSTQQVMGLNDEGRCVGNLQYDGAFYFDGRTIWNLQDLVVNAGDWHISQAVGINNEDQIVVMGWNGPVYQALMLYPSEAEAVDRVSNMREAEMVQEYSFDRGVANYYAKWLPDQLVVIGDNNFYAINPTTGEQLAPPRQLASSGPQVNQQTVGQVCDAGSHMVTLSGQGLDLKVWDIADPAQSHITSTIKSAEGFYDVAISADGSRLVTAGAGDDRTSAVLWDVKTGKRIGSPMRHASHATRRIYRVRFSSDGRRILTVNSLYGAVQVWDGKSAKKIGRPIELSGVRDAIFSPSGKQVLVISATGRVIAYSTRSSRKVWESNIFPLDCRSITFSPDGELVAVTGQSMIYEGSSIWTATVVMGAKNGERMTGLLRHDSGTGFLGRSGAVFSPDGSLLATHSSTGNTACIWDLNEGGRPYAKPLIHPRMVSNVQFDVSGSRLITSCTDGFIRQWRLPVVDLAP